MSYLITEAGQAYLDAVALQQIAARCAADDARLLREIAARLEAMATRERRGDVR